MGRVAIGTGLQCTRALESLLKSTGLPTPRDFLILHILIFRYAWLVLYIYIYIYCSYILHEEFILELLFTLLL